MSPGQHSKGKGGKFPSDGFCLDMEGQGGQLRNRGRILKPEAREGENQQPPGVENKTRRIYEANCIAESPLQGYDRELKIKRGFQPFKHR